VTGPRAPGARRRSRERALELLYEAEAKGISPDLLLGELPVAPEPYALLLVQGVAVRSAEIDELVSSHANAWALERMPVVDRQLLRLATFELLGSDDVPVAVVLDEAVELAKSYSTEDSSRFVNGVLVAIAAVARPGQVGSA
jgi:N utilization substance protein B